MGPYRDPDSTWELFGLDICRPLATGTLTSYQNYTIIVSGWTPKINTVPITSINYDSYYEIFLTSNESLTWTISKGLSGFNIQYSAQGYDLQGTFSGYGPYNVGVMGTDIYGNVAYLNWTVNIITWKPTYTTNPPVNLILGNTYSYPIGLNETSTITLVNGPSWLSLSNNVLSGTPTSTGSYPVSIKALGQGGLYAWQNWTIEVRQWAPALENSPLTTITLDHAYSYVMLANESITETLVSGPSFLSLSGTTLSGTPINIGSYAIELKAIGEGGAYTWLNYTLTVTGWGPTITSAPITATTIGHTYSYSMTANESVTWSMILPDPTG